jgi:adenosylhomocysteine nucleosidase
MPDALFAPRVCVLFALPEEAAPFRQQKQQSDWILSIACSGTGVRNAARHTALLLDDPGPEIRCLLICGFAGALNGLAVGDVVVAERVLDYCGQDNPTHEYRADSQLLATAESVRLSDLTVQFGALATLHRVLLNRADKDAFSQQGAAVCVDMETAGAARMAGERGVPWLAIRAISDGIDDEMPLDFNAFTDADGNVDRGRIVRATLAQPWKIPALLRLGARSSLAARNLAAFVEAFLKALPDGSSS